MKVSIITAVYNGVHTIEECIKSVLNQTHLNIEYIIIDGGSTDGTLDVIKKYKDKIAYCISEPDNGIYDAMNKGIKLASGDVVGILNADDFYADNYVISNVAKEFEIKKVDSVFAGLVFIDRNNPDKIVRYCNASSFKPEKFAYGWMPPHPTFFVKRKIYEMYGLFKTDYKIASDFELVARFLSKYKVSYSYIQKVLIKMRTGGLSTRNIKSNWILNKEILHACQENGIKTNYLKIYSKYLTKVFQLFNRPG